MSQELSAFKVGLRRLKGRRFDDGLNLRGRFGRNLSLRFELLELTTDGISQMKRIFLVK